MGPEQYRQRIDVPEQDRWVRKNTIFQTMLIWNARRALSKNIPSPDPSNFQTTLQGLRPHLLSPLSGYCSARTRASSEHEFQALCPLH